MAWIDIIDEDDADGRLAEVYDTIADARGKIAEILRIQSLAPDALLHHLKLYTAVMFGSRGLSRAERELVATVVSVHNQCDYCVEHHATALRAYWPDDRVDAVIDDWTTADLDDRQYRLAEHARSLTVAPDSVSESDLDTLRTHDLSDTDLLNLTLVIAYFNFVNRLALGLGVHIDDPTGFDY